ncbi:DUF723 domain-containing protein [Pseudomonas sp.]|uniref:DUF723 domain-containing protein n=1 Tax=Pseudomonas sp. TaxID=306 RepID=UPI0025831CF6|nr:DUF723 domain-containing protein [Pseudomonas sp.]
MIPEAVFEKFHPTVQSNFDFSNASYKQALTPIVGIICPTHGEFMQYSAQLRKEHGAHCPQCGAARRTSANTTSVPEFVARASAIHNGKYRYPTEGGFTAMAAKVTVECPQHGSFSIRALKHIYAAQGCPDCGALSRGHRKNIHSSVKSAATKVMRYADTFKTRATELHGDKYDYTESVYVGMKSNVDIKCPIHGTFSQNAYGHAVAGYGCPRCGNSLSKGEEEVFAHLQKLTRAEQRNRKLIKPRELDVYMPDVNMAVEYCGEYHHSHKTAEDEKLNKHRHFKKYEDCKALGIRLITLYESEWKDHNYAVRRLLRNAVGKSKGKLMARKCELRKATGTEARAFYERYHPQGGTGSGEHYALFWKGKMVACMRFVLGANDRGAGASNRTWTLGRYATRVTVAGAASRLFKAFVQEHNPPAVKSFSDNRFFEGGMYAQLGFTLEAEVPPDYQVWTQKGGLRPKSHYQRRLIPTRLLENGSPGVFDPATDPRTEVEMTYLMGASRIYDCGKKRWVWTRAAGPAIID